MWAKKLQEFYRVFTPDELDEMRLFLQSPFFNRGGMAQSSLQLFDLLRSVDVRETWPDASGIYKTLFPSTAPVSGKLSKLVSYQTKQFKQYIRIRESENPTRQSAPLSLSELQFYRKRGLHQRFEQELRRLEKFYEESLSANQEEMHLRFRLANERVEYYASRNKRKDDLHIPKLLDRLDWYYLFSRMEYALAFLAQGIHVSLPRMEIEHLLADVDALPGESSFLNIPVVGVYHSMLRFLLRKDAASLEALEGIRRKLKKADAHLLPGQKHLLFGLLRHQVIATVNRGNQAYLASAFEIYREHLEAGYLYYGKKITPSTYRNMVTMGLRLGAFDWTNNFLEIYRNRMIGADHPEEVYRFNRANLFFHQGAFEDALDLLGARYDDLYYELAARRLEIKILFEIQSPLLDSKMEAFKVFVFRLSRKRLPKIQAEGNNHFIDLLRRIINPATLGNTERIEVLKKQFAEEQVLAERDWLEEKLADLR